MEEIFQHNPFHPVNWLNFLKFLKKDANLQNEISQTSEKNNKESFSNEISNSSKRVYSKKKL